MTIIMAGRGHVCFRPGKRQTNRQTTVAVVLPPIFKICQFVANAHHAIGTNGVKVGWRCGGGGVQVQTSRPAAATMLCWKGGVRQAERGWQVFANRCLFFPRLFFFFFSLSLRRVPQTQCQSISRQHPLRLLPLGMRWGPCWESGQKMAVCSRG